MITCPLFIRVKNISQSDVAYIEFITKSGDFLGLVSGFVKFLGQKIPTEIFVHQLLKLRGPW